MRKRFFTVACSAVLIGGLGLCAVAAPTPPATPATAPNPATAVSSRVPVSGVDVTGAQWGQSSQNEKLAFLYGASSIIAIEQLIAEEKGQQPSPFVSAWMKAFKDKSWMDLQKQLDGWYAAHPEQAKRQVFDVLWFEFMAPATGK